MRGLPKHRGLVQLAAKPLGSAAQGWRSRSRAYACDPSNAAPGGLCAGIVDLLGHGRLHPREASDHGCARNQGYGRNYALRSRARPNACPHGAFSAAGISRLALSRRRRCAARYRAGQGGCCRCHAASDAASARGAALALKCVRKSVKRYSDKKHRKQGKALGPA